MKERDRDRERQREKDTETDRARETETDKKRYRQRERERAKERGLLLYITQRTQLYSTHFTPDAIVIETILHGQEPRHSQRTTNRLLGQAAGPLGGRDRW